VFSRCTSLAQPNNDCFLFHVHHPPFIVLSTVLGGPFLSGIIPDPFYIIPDNFTQAGAHTPVCVHLQAWKIQVAVSATRFALNLASGSTYGPTAIQKVSQEREG